MHPRQMYPSKQGLCLSSSRLPQDDDNTRDDVGSRGKSRPFEPLMSARVMLRPSLINTQASSRFNVLQNNHRYYCAGLLSNVCCITRTPCCDVSRSWNVSARSSPRRSSKIVPRLPNFVGYDWLHDMDGSDVQGFIVDSRHKRRPLPMTKDLSSSSKRNA